MSVDIWNSMLKARCYHVVEEIIFFAPNIHQKLLFRAPNAEISLPWEGVSQGPSPTIRRFAPSQFSSQITLETWKYKSFPDALARFACWLNSMMHVCETTFMLKVWCYRLAPLLFGGNHIIVIFAQICIRNGFFRAPNAKFFLTWEGEQPHPDPPPPPPAWSLRSLAVLPADYFRRHGNICHFHRRLLALLARSLIIMINVSKTACLKLDVILLPMHVQFGGNHILVIFAPNMHQKLFSRAPNAKSSLHWEGMSPPPGVSPPPLGRFAPGEGGGGGGRANFAFGDPRNSFLIHIWAKIYRSDRAWEGEGKFCI